MTQLLYRIVPHNGSVVFAREGRARSIAAIHYALDTATTWGEFHGLVPKDVYDRLAKRMTIDDDDGDDDDENDDETEPNSSDEFDGSWFTEEGDFPDWLQAEMDLVIPRDLLEQYGESRTTFLNGNYYHIPEQNMEPMVEALRARGHVVQRAQDLQFW